MGNNADEAKGAIEAAASRQTDLEFLKQVAAHSEVKNEMPLTGFKKLKQP